MTIAVMGAALLLAGIAVSGALDALFRLALYRHEVQGAPSLGLAPEHLAFLRVRPRRRGLRRRKD